MKDFGKRLWVEKGDGDPALIGSQCADCGFKAFPARRICARCQSEKQTELILSSYGAIYSYTKVCIKSPVVDEIPYLVGYVLLEDGLVAPARLRGSVDQVDIGTPVVLEIATANQAPEDGEYIGYFFRPVKEGRDE